MHTWAISHWSLDRDRHDPLHLPIGFTVRKLTGDNARLYGLHDRGLLEPGRRADVNLLDLSRLGTAMPEMIYDLPAAQPRLLARAQGYVGTWVNGQRVIADDRLTGARPGGVVRGRRYSS